VSDQNTTHKSNCRLLALSDACAVVRRSAAGDAEMFEAARMMAEQKVLTQPAGRRTRFRHSFFGLDEKSIPFSMKLKF
jgi:hypothetical protein